MARQPIRVAIATAAEFPDLDEDGPLLLRALADRGLAGEPAVWTDPTVAWSSYDVVVVRSTWDYHHRLGEFLDWADRVSAATVLANPAEVLRWNTDKTYLRELTVAGLPVVQTDWLQSGDRFSAPATGEYVVKPAVSVGSLNTNRYRAGEHDEIASGHVQDLLDAGHTVMVQPYLVDVDSHGETALLFFGGEFSHAIRKASLLEPAMELVTGAYKEEEIEPRVASEVEREVADRVLDTLPWSRRRLAYARVDLVPGPDSAPTLLEVELTEPSMFLGFDPADAAADRFAAAIEALTPGRDA